MRRAVRLGYSARPALPCSGSYNFFLGKYLREYLDALRRLEIRHYRKHLRTGKAWFHWRNQVPSVADLSRITGEAVIVDLATPTPPGSPYF